MSHLQANGFRVEATNVSDAQLNAISMQAGVTPNLSSCHTATVNGYTVVGHVPAADIHRMLKEKPAITGITVPVDGGYCSWGAPSDAFPDEMMQAD